MGLKNGYSGNVGLPELIVALKEFERANSVRIGLSAFLVEAKGRTDWEFALGAWQPGDLEQEAMPLALVSRRCMESRLVTVEALLLQLLYAMDFQLGLLEFQKAGETK